MNTKCSTFVFILLFFPSNAWNKIFPWVCLSVFLHENTSSWYIQVPSVFLVTIHCGFHKQDFHQARLLYTKRCHGHHISSSLLCSQVIFSTDFQRSHSLFETWNKYILKPDLIDLSMWAVSRAWWYSKWLHKHWLYWNYLKANA